MEEAIRAYLDLVAEAEKLAVGEVQRLSLEAVHYRLEESILGSPALSHTVLTLSATELAVVFLALSGNTERHVIEKDALARLDALHRCAGYVRDHGQSKLADAMVTFYDPRLSTE